MFNMLSAGIVMGIMIIPYVSSLSEDAMRSRADVAARRLVCTGCESRAYRLSRRLSGGAVRHRGGLRARHLAGDRRDDDRGDRRGHATEPHARSAQPAETITAYIVQVSLGDLPHGSIGYQSIFAAGLTLFLMTLAFNILGHYLRKRFRQAY